MSMVGYPYKMPTAPLAKLESKLNTAATFLICLSVSRALPKINQRKFAPVEQTKCNMQHATFGIFMVYIGSNNL